MKEFIKNVSLKRIYRNINPTEFVGKAYMGEVRLLVVKDKLEMLHAIREIISPVTNLKLLYFLLSETRYFSGKGSFLKESNNYKRWSSITA